MRQKKLKLTKENEKMLNDAIKDVMKRPTVRGTPRDLRRSLPRGLSRLRHSAVDLDNQRYITVQAEEQPHLPLNIHIDDSIPAGSAVLQSSGGDFVWHTTEGWTAEAAQVEQQDPFSLDDPNIQVYAGDNGTGFQLYTPIGSSYYTSEYRLTNVLIDMNLTGATILRLQGQINTINEARRGNIPLSSVWNQPVVLGAESGFSYPHTYAPAGEVVSVTGTNEGLIDALRNEISGLAQPTVGGVNVGEGTSMEERIDSLYNFVINNQETMAVRGDLTISDPFNDGENDG